MSEPQRWGGMKPLFIPLKSEFYEAFCNGTKDTEYRPYGQRPADVLKLTVMDVRDGFLRVTQGKTGAKLRIALNGELGRLIATLMPPKSGRVVSTHLIRNEDEQRLTYSAMAQRFYAIRGRAVKIARESGQVDFAASLRNFQFRDLRARAATDIENAQDAQNLLAHSSITMTEHYRRSRLGAKVKPVK